MTRLALFDLDGTLSDDSARREYFVQGEATKYWDRDLMLADPVISRAFNLYRALETAGTEMGILSARRESLNRTVTDEWLHNATLKPHYLFLKPTKFSYMKPEEFKCMKLAGLLDSSYYSDVVFYENDKSVVDYINDRLPGEHAQWVEWIETK